jgi:hypothetical protein
METFAHAMLHFNMLLPKQPPNEAAALDAPMTLLFQTVRRSRRASERQR